MKDISKKLLEHFQNPKNVGVIVNADGYGKVENPICGDMTEMYIKVEKNILKDVKFKSYGCFATIASASALSEAVKGKKIDGILKGERTMEQLMDMVMKELGDIPKKKMHCPPAPIEAFLKAIQDYCAKKNEEKMVKKIDDVLSSVKCYYKVGLEE